MEGPGVNAHTNLSFFPHHRHHHNHPVCFSLLLGQMGYGGPARYESGGRVSSLEIWNSASLSKEFLEGLVESDAGMAATCFMFVSLPWVV